MNLRRKTLETRDIISGVRICNIAPAATSSPEYALKVCLLNGHRRAELRPNCAAGN